MEVVDAPQRRPDALILETPRGPIEAKTVIACAGLWADRVAALTGDRSVLRDDLAPDVGSFDPDAGLGPDQIAAARARGHAPMPT